jgi:hypothetical protein
MVETCRSTKIDVLRSLLETKICVHVANKFVSCIAIANKEHDWLQTNRAGRHSGEAVH